MATRDQPARSDRPRAGRFRRGSARRDRRLRRAVRLLASVCHGDASVADRRRRAVAHQSSPRRVHPAEPHCRQAQVPRRLRARRRVVRERHRAGGHRLSAARRALPARDRGNVTEGRATGVVDAFRRRHGRDPDGVFSAPGRVNLIGEHTDYNEGLVLPVAIEQSAVVAVGRRADGKVAGWSAQLGDGGMTTIAADYAPSADGWLAYAAGVAWAMRDLVGAQGLDLVVDSDVPLGAGLSSSAALECAVALALAEIASVDVDRMALAVAAQRAEHEVVGAPVGVMDQAVSLLARPQTALFLDCRTLISQLVPFRPSAADLALLVIDTHVHHAHAGGDYATRRRECEQAASILGLPSLRDATTDGLERLPNELRRRARHVVSENARVENAVAVLTGDGVTALGPVLDASHRSLRDDFEVSVTELDTAVTAAVYAGALGARVPGGGVCAAALALPRVGDRAPVTEAVARAFAAAGFAPPEI